MESKSPSNRKTNAHPPPRENKQFLNTDKDEIDLDDEIRAKKTELSNLKRVGQKDPKKLDCLDGYDEFIAKIQAQQAKRSDEEADQVWANINSEMEKELKSLEMIQLFIKKNRADGAKEIEVDESALLKANDILRHLEQK